MQRLLLCLLPILAWRAGGANLTVVVDFDGPQSYRSVQQMKRETEAILKPAGVHLDWRACAVRWAAAPTKTW